MKRGMIDLFNTHLLRHADARIVRRSQLYPWQQHDDAPVAAADTTALSAAALAYLTPANPRLAELRAIYADFDPVVTGPLIWVDDMVTADQLNHFRGDNAFIYQRQGLRYTDLAYALTAYYTASAPEGAVLARLREDGAFGVHGLDIADRTISRDLLDSAREIDFLTRHVIPAGKTLRVLDIGAGYGRLPHRLTEALGDRVQAYATDAFPVSTFLCEFYLRHRDSCATVVPLHEFDDFIATTPIDVAVNVHSFSECTVAAIDWWVSRLARHGVRHLMVVPNGEVIDTLGCCRTNDGHDMEAIFARHGYKIATRAFRYADPMVRRYGIDTAQLNLFTLAEVS